ncbi:O-antigen ligase family protein [Halomonas sp. H5]|uniref:O-antigen ligase family protein n=1 Tax=Halomonas sp. H5 TaxID=3423910 RepID=UPI003D36B116
MTLGIHAVTRLVLPSLGELSGTLLALVGLFAVLRWGKAVRSSAPLWLLLAAVLVQLLSWGLGMLHHPEWMPGNPKLDRLAKLFAFIAIAWWLAGDTRYTLRVWGLALLGVLAATLITVEARQDWLLGFGGRRVGFAIYNAQHAAMYFGAGVLGLLAFAGRLMKPGPWRWLRVGLWVACGLACALGLIFTQTRAAWLGVAFGLIGMLVAWLVWWYRAWQRGRSPWRMVALLVVGLGVTAMIGAGFEETVAKRLASERQVIGSLMDGEVDEVPYTSAGIRIHTWVAATEWIAERPLVGWGENARTLVVQQTEWLPETIRSRFGHLHNSILEILVSYGLLGGLLFLALSLWLLWGSYRAWRAGVMPGDMALFFLGFSIFWFIINLFESFMAFWTGVFLFNIILGGIVTHIWRWQTGEPAFDPSRT